jgi:N-glycosylase/DNA lyase
MDDAPEEPREEPEFTQEEFQEMARLSEQKLGAVDDGVCPVDPRDNPEFKDSEAQGAGTLIERQRAEKGLEPAVIHDSQQQIDDFEEWNDDWEPPQRFLKSPEPPIDAPHELQIRPDESQVQLENFANLTDLEDALRKIETEHIETGDSDTGPVEEARVAVVQAVERAYLSRFHLGKALFAYRKHFKAERGWMEVAKAIGDVMHRSDKTVRNIISDYERLYAALPPAVIEVADARGIDLARKKFLQAVKTIEAKIGPDDVVDRDQASRIIDQVIPIKPASITAKPRLDLDDFAERTVRSFEKRYNGHSQEVRDAEVRYILELINATLRSSIRELRQYGRPALVPKPATKEAGVA